MPKYLSPTLVKLDELFSDLDDCIREVVHRDSIAESGESAFRIMLRGKIEAENTLSQITEKLRDYRKELDKE
jgi:hypothetical protein